MSSSLDSRPWGLHLTILGYQLFSRFYSYRLIFKNFSNELSLYSRAVGLYLTIFAMSSSLNYRSLCLYVIILVMSSSLDSRALGLYLTIFNFQVCTRSKIWLRFNFTQLSALRFTDPKSTSHHQCITRDEAYTNHLCSESMYGYYSI